MPANVAERITTYLSQAARDAGASPITLESGLLESGLLDSMGLVGLVQFLEAEFDLDIPEAEIGPELFATPASLISYVERRLA
jgi:acyl carrier protein